MSATDRPGTGRAPALWIGAVVLAAAATAVLVLSEDARVLKLGLVAALWAALFGALAVAKLRSRIAAADREAAERQRIYELELEREIAARREHEAAAEAEARRRAAADADGEIQALKAELRALRENLEKVLGGDVLFERVALRAESTRVRSFGEQGGQVDRQLSAAQGAIDAEHARRQPHPSRPAPRQPNDPRAPRGGPAPAAVQHSWPGQNRRPQPAAESSESRTGQIPAVAATASWPEMPAAQGNPGGPDPRGNQQQAEAMQWPQHDQAADTGQQPEPAGAGAHAEGTSAIDLIAAYGGSSGDGNRRRRRRD